MSALLGIAAAATVLQLAVDQGSLPPDVSLPVVAKEVRAIWKPLVDVVFTTDRGSCVSCGDRLALHITDAPPAEGPDPEAIGWIRFVDGRPQPTVSIAAAPVRRVLADGVWMGRPLKTLPRGAQSRFLSIAVGRAVAHEIGHYVFRSPAHHPQGLMRARFTLRDFLDTNSGHFRAMPLLDARLETGTQTP
jgi:hypothetical protein